MMVKNKTLDDWHEFWKNNGEPHPSSNKYLELTRLFWYNLGFEAGIKIQKAIDKKE